MYDNDQEYGWKSYDNQGYEGRPYNEPQFDQGPNFNQGPSGGHDHWEAKDHWEAGDHWETRDRPETGVLQRKGADC